MSWRDSRGAGVTIRESAGESARFGHTVERLTVGDGWNLGRAELVGRLAHEVAASAARTIILRYPSEHVFIVKSLDLRGRAVFPAGTLAYWERSTADVPSPSAIVEQLAPPVDAATAAEAMAVIADSFDGYVNHYHANPLIDESAVTAGYLEWAQGTLDASDGRVFVVRQGDAIAGVATVEAAEGSDHWEILLAGMASAFQGRGLYLELVRGVLAAAAGAGVPRVYISTQAHNIAVQRAWAKLGFSPVASIDTVHLVADA